MNIVIKPIVKMTLDIRGSKMHDVGSLVEKFFDMDVTVAVVDCGSLSYKNPISMGNSIEHYAQITNRKVSFHPIKGDDREIIIFKV